MKNISIKAVLTEAQEAFMKSPWHWVFVAAIEGFILLGCIPLIAVFEAAIGSIFEASAPWFVYNVLPLVASLLYMAITWSLMLALYRMSEAALAGTKPEVSDIFHSDTRLMPFILTVLLVSIITYFGLKVFVVPGLVAAVVLFLADVSSVEEHTSAVDSLYRSYELVRKDWWSVILFMIVSGALSIVAIIPFGLGLLFYVPFMTIAKIILFRHLRSFEPMALSK